MAFDAFLKIEGIDGESQDDKHKGWIEILSFSVSAQQPVSATASSSGGATTQRVNIQHFSVTKSMDKASPKLFEACCTGQHFGTVTIELCRAGGGENKLKYMEYKLSNAVIASVHPSGTAGGSDVPHEEIGFDFGKIEMTYVQQQRKDGSGSGNVSAGWDLQTNKKV